MTQIYKLTVHIIKDLKCYVTKFLAKNIHALAYVANLYYNSLANTRLYNYYYYSCRCSKKKLSWKSSDNLRHVCI